MGEDAVRTWLVERTFSDRNLVTLTYATPDGERALTRELSATVLDGTTVTAARSVDADRLAPVTDPDRRARYRNEVRRVRANHDPDDPI